MRPALLLLLPFVLALPAQAGPVLQVYSMLYPPLHNGQPAAARPGIGDELIRRAANLAGQPVDIITLPWRRAQLLAAQKPLSCIFPLTRQPSREQQYAWVGMIAPGQLRLYGWPGTPPLPSLAAARTLRLTVLAGSSAETRLQQHGLAYSTTNQVGEGLRLLQLGMADVWVVHEAVARYEAAQARLHLATLGSLGEANSWLACHRNMPDAPLHALQQAWASLQASGEAAQIREAYLGPAGGDEPPGRGSVRP